MHTMTARQGLLTEYDRECLRGDHGSERESAAKARVKERIREVVSEDIRIMADRHPDLVMELQDAVGGGQASLGEWARGRESPSSPDIE
jgi:hypothetical protein